MVRIVWYIKDSSILILLILGGGKMIDNIIFSRFKTRRIAMFGIALVNSVTKFIAVGALFIVIGVTSTFSISAIISTRISIASAPARSRITSYLNVPPITLVIGLI